MVETGITPLLGAQANQEMDLISVNFENIAALENSLSAKAGMTKESFISKFPSVFGRELGCIEGMLHLEMDPSSAPVQMALRRVPLALREPLKTELERLEELGVIEKISRPTEWTSALVMVRKPNGAL